MTTTDGKISETLSAIAGMVARTASPNPEGAFLYAEAERAFVSTAVFNDVGDFVQYYHCSDGLSMAVLDLWYLCDPAKKWAALLLTIVGEEFDARFQYPEDWGDDDDGERRQKVLRAKYGDKEVRYPSFDDMSVGDG